MANNVSEKAMSAELLMATAVTTLQQALRNATALEAMVILPLIQRAANMASDIRQLKDAVRAEDGISSLTHGEAR